MNRFVNSKKRFEIHLILSFIIVVRIIKVEWYRDMESNL